MNKVENLFSDLSKKQQTRVISAWCAKFKRTERQFDNRLKNPTAADYGFWSIVFNKPTDDLMEHLKDQSIRQHLRPEDTTSFVASMGLTSI